LNLLLLVLAGVIVVTLAVVLAPLLRRRGAPVDARQFDRAVYRDQLGELDREVAQGLIGAEEAQAARLEIQRRLLAVDAAPGEAAPTVRAGRSLMLAGVLGLLLVAGATGIYARLGAPGMPDLPLAARAVADPERAEMERAMDALRDRLRGEPDNIEGWLLYARSSAALDRWAESRDAYRHVIEKLPDQPEVLAALGEAETMTASGMVTPAAELVLKAALAKDPANAVARYYLALADAQAGAPDKAIPVWLALAGAAPEGSPMRAELTRRIAEASQALGKPAPPLPAAQPAEMPPSPEMIKAMVAQLAERLSREPNDAAGWLRLGRSYLVLHEPAKSADAYDRAASLRPGDAEVALQEVAAQFETLPRDAPVPERVKMLLQRIAATAPDNPEGLWYQGLAALRGGDRQTAAAAWTRLLPLLPPGSDNRAAVQNALDLLRPR
jgi:cytochrome c-type biogenesis protein CcmH